MIKENLQTSNLAKEAQKCMLDVRYILSVLISLQSFQMTSKICCSNGFGVNPFIGEFCLFDRLWLHF